MKRYASLDFLRGIAILMMLSLHITNAYMDKAIIENINNIPIIFSLLLVLLPFFGGLAGFFLLISAIGNMISMQKYLQKGKSVSSLLTRQIIGGVLIIIFGMLSEGVTGYHGTFGKIMAHLPQIINDLRLDDPQYSTLMGDLRKTLYYWNNFETIHTIGWCVVLNGIVQGILSRKKHTVTLKKQMAIYIILAVVVLVITPFIWNLIFESVPGYPWATNPDTGHELSLPEIGISSFGEIVRNIFLTALAAEVEPILPYLAVSFIGSVIGIGLSMPRERLPKNFVKKILITGLLMFFIGFVAVILVLTQTGGFTKMLNHYMKIHQHRNWDPNYPDANFPPFAYLPQFLFLNGFSLMGTMMVIYLVEYRGKGAKFAAKTKFVRRFGFIAFTNYNQQYLYYLVAIGLSFITGKENDYGLFIFPLVGICLLVFHLVNRLWEKIDYIGSIEWWVGSLGKLLIPARRVSNSGKQKWWRKGALDVKNAFYDAEWISVYAQDELSAEYWAKSLRKIALFSFTSILFIPFNVGILIILLRNKSTMGQYKQYRRALTISIIATALFGAFLIFVCIFSPAMLNITI